MPSQDVQQRLNNLTGNALNTVLAEIERRVGDQLTEVSGLNSRASAGLASGSILSGLTGLQAVVQTARPSASVLSQIKLLLEAGLAAYVVVVAAAIAGYWIWGFDTGPDPAIMVSEYGPAQPQPAGQAELEVDAIKRSMAGKLIDAFDTNARKIRGKLVWTWIVFIGLAVEAGLLVWLTYLQLQLLQHKPGA